MLRFMIVMAVSGPMSHLLNGVYEQSFIADVMAYSACVGRWELSLIFERTYLKIIGNF